jgi:hypothetical protein
MTWNRMTEFAPIGLVFADRRRSSRIIRTLGDAAATLLRDWPSDDGEEYKTAVKACADAISGEIEPAEFRKRLIRAAGEPGITAFSIVH